MEWDLVRLPSTASFGCTSFSSPVFFLFFTTFCSRLTGDQWTDGERNRVIRIREGVVKWRIEREKIIV